MYLWMRRWSLMTAVALLLLLDGCSIFTAGSHPNMPLGKDSRALLEKMVELAPRLEEGYVGENESSGQSESVDEYDDDDDEVPPVRPEDLPYLGEGSKVVRVPNLFRKSKRQIREEREKEKAEKQAKARKAEEERQRKAVAEMQAVVDAASREEEEKRRRHEEMYFELTELLRRMAAGDQVNPEDLPAEIKGDFARACDDGALGDALFDCTPWWEEQIPEASPRERERGGKDQGALPRTEFETFQGLTYNGGRTSKGAYWAQDMTECIVSVPVEPGDRGKDVNITLKEKFLSVAVRGKIVLEGEMAYHVRYDDDVEWELKEFGDRKLVKITLQKSARDFLFNSTNEAIWWSRLFEGDIIASTAFLDRNTLSLSSANHQFQPPPGAPPLPPEGFPPFDQLCPGMQPSPVLPAHMASILMAYAVVYRVLRGRLSENLLLSVSLVSKLCPILGMRPGQKVYPETVDDCLAGYDSGTDQCMGFLGERLLSGLRTKGLEDTRALLEAGQGDAAARAVGHLWHLFGSGEKQAELFVEERKREKPSAIGKQHGDHGGSVGEEGESHGAEEEDRGEGRGAGREGDGDGGKTQKDELPIFLSPLTGLPVGEEFVSWTWGKDELCPDELERRRLKLWFFGSWWTSGGLGLAEGTLQRIADLAVESSRATSPERREASNVHLDKENAENLPGVEGRLGYEWNLR